MTERPWTEEELAEMERLVARAGYTKPMVAAALDRSLHSVKARWKRWRRGRRTGKQPAAPPRPRRGPRPYLSLERSLAAGRAHPVVLALLREIVSRRLHVDRLCARAGISAERLRCWGRGDNAGLYNLAAALETVGLRLTVEKMESEE